MRVFHSRLERDLMRLRLPEALSWAGKKTNGSRYTAVDTILLGVDASQCATGADTLCPLLSFPSRVRKSINIHQSPSRNGTSPGARKEASKITPAC